MVSATGETKSIMAFGSNKQIRNNATGTIRAAGGSAALAFDAVGSSNKIWNYGRIEAETTPAGHAYGCRPV